MATRGKAGRAIAGWVLVMGFACRTRPRAPEPSALWTASERLPPMCEGPEESPLSGTLAVAVWANGAGEGLAEQTRHAATYYGGRGLRLEGSAPRAITARAAFAALTLDPELQSILTEPSRGEDLRLVFLPRIAGPASPINGRLPELAGLTVSRDSAAALRLPEPRVPTIFLSSRELRLLPEVMRKFTLAHEIGHVLGQEHPVQPMPWHLMSSERRSDCTPRFVELR